MTSDTETKTTESETKPEAAAVDAKASEAEEAEDEEAEDEESEESEDEESEDEEEDDEEVEYEATMSRQEAAAYLDALLAGLRGGHLEFRRGERALTLALPSHVELEVEAKGNATKGKIEVEIKWRPVIQPLTLSAPSDAGPAASDDEDDD